MKQDNSAADVAIKYPSAPPVFLIGTSGKGVNALRFLAEHIPAHFPAPLFFLLHRKRESTVKHHHLLELVSAKSQLPAVIPQIGDPVRPGTIYVPPYNQHLTVADDHIIVTNEPSDGMWRPSIDALFTTGAHTYRDRTVSVLLTGGLDDGVEGLRETTRQGGITIAQSPEDAYDPILPLNALLKDHPQYVLPLRDMPTLFCELARCECSDEQKMVAKKAAEAAARKKEEVKG